MVSVFILRVVGFIIITAIVGFGLVLWVKVSKLEKEIEDGLNRSGEE